MKAKYIVIRTEHGKELMFTFPHEVTHYWMREAVQTLRQGVPPGWTRPYRQLQVVSAGFINADGTCEGRSDSLGIHSRPEIDTKLFLSGSYA